MNSEVFNLVVFNCTHAAIKAEKELLLAEIKVRIIPVPRQITADCGISIKVNTADLDLVKKVIEDKNIQVSGYYYIKKAGLNKEIYEC